MPLTIIDDPADWKASEWEGREEDYTYRFTTQVRHRLMFCMFVQVLDLVDLAVTYSRAVS